MGTSSWLATFLDLEMLRGLVADAHTPDDHLPKKPGGEVAGELCGRYLIRYVRAEQVGRFAAGSNDKHWVTPTPYSPEETVGWLALKDPMTPRPYAMLLDPSRIDEVWGPRRVLGGQGIEYLLPGGFSQAAVILGWEMEVR
jgi:hypothetical protein